MTTTRTQYRAICSICGRQQAVNAAGDLAAHAFDLHYGFQNGKCVGSGHPHWGLADGRDYALKIAADLRNNAERLRAWAGEVLEETSKRAVYATRSSVIGERRIENPTPRERGRYSAELSARSRDQEHMAGQLERSAAEWTAAEAVAVQVPAERKAPACHFFRKGWGAHCASSAMGAQRLIYTTPDRSRVSCPKCLERLAEQDARQAAKAATSQVAA